MNDNRMYVAQAPHDVRRVRCYNCGGLGHVSYDCISPRLDKACYNCGHVGHLAQDCRIKGMSGGIVCYKCQRPGHIAKDCHFDQYAGPGIGGNSGGFRRERTCYQCNKTGHLVRDCPAPPGEKTCYTCNTAGHVAKDCPNAPAMQIRG
jgi:cellular nucleic acid-binding protein